MTKSYMTEILERFMSKKELRELEKKYQKAKKRKSCLGPLTEKERSILDLYLQGELSLSMVAQRLKIKPISAGNKVRTLALRKLAEEHGSLRRKVELKIKQ